MYMDITEFDANLVKHETVNTLAYLVANFSALALVFSLCTLAMPGSIFVAVVGIMISVFTYAWSFQKIEELEKNA